ncbi:MAG TPA: hypothetical protein GX405_16365 [Rhizobiales bacterium]|nr:hypothetical protein [Hyphomicrobiales bacterium]
MLKTAMITATILGCDCDARQCEYIRDEPVQWTTIEDCESEIGKRTFDGAGPAYPTVIAVCYAPAASAADAATPEPAKQVQAASAAAGTPTSGRIFAGTVKGYVVVRQSLGSAVDATFDAARWTLDRLGGLTLSGF